MNREMTQGKYLRFMMMIGLSMLVMYMLTYLNSYQILDHAWFSETRLFMTMMMGAAMIVIMLGFMHAMYPRSAINVAIYGFAAVLFIAGLSLVRTQATVDDTDYMQGMIPHHSIAVLTSERARIEDRRVRELADSIIDAQRREIKEMGWLIEDIKKNGVASSQAEAELRPVPSFSGTEGEAD